MKERGNDMKGKPAAEVKDWTGQLAGQATPEVNASDLVRGLATVADRKSAR